jgi:hypothetical protein
MGVCMKTTVEISDSLLERARQTARREKTTVRQLIEEGLRHVLADRRRRGPFRLRNASFKGDGLHADVAAAGWDRIRDHVYEGRGA